MGTEHLHPTPHNIEDKIRIMQDAITSVSPEPADPTVNEDPNITEAIRSMQNAFDTINIGNFDSLTGES